MKKTFLRSMATVALMVVGCIAANAKVLVPFGIMSSQPWEGKYFHALISDEQQAPANWFAADFDDTAWGTITGPVTDGSLSYSNTAWTENYSSYWVRTHFTIDELSDSKTYTFYAAHDDECVAYLNGVQIYSSNSVQNYSTVQLTGDALAALKKGDNVLAVYVSDSGGGNMYMDFGLYENDLNDIVTRADVPVAITNDATYPWEVSGTEARNGNYNTRYSTSWLTMQYSAAYRTELSFDWYEYNYSTHQPLQLYIDGVLAGSTSNSSWNTTRFYLDAGDHVVAFRDSIGSYNTSSNRSGVRNVKVKEILPLETAVLTENSLPISFENNDTYPWTIEDGYIQSGNYGYRNTTSRISTTFTVEKTSKFSFLYRCMRTDGNSGNGSYHLTLYKVNGIQFDYAENRTAFNNRLAIALEPGTYTIEIVDSVGNTTTAYVSQLKDVELSTNWIDVDLATAGTLGYEVLYSGKANELRDVEFLKISGPMNASDWTDIKNMTNLLALDLSEAEITEIPNNAFDGKGWLNSVILPEGITRIGNYAFRGTNIRRINIPSTVQTIGEYSFISTPLQYLTFAENTQIETISQFAFASCSSLQSVDFNGATSLTTIANAAFYNCKALKEFVMPNSVTSIGYSVLQDCSSLKKVVFSNGITSISDHFCSGCTSLEELSLPENLKAIRYASFNSTGSLKKVNLPSTVNEIRAYAFQSCGIDSLKLPISMQYLYRYAFNNCKSLKYIEMPSYLERGGVDYYTSYYYASGTSINSGYYYDERRFYGYYNNFRNCTAIEKVVMRSATPPTIDSDAFNDASAKSAITLVVPSFSVVNYKLDSYWYQFGSIVEGDDVDYWKITSPLMLTNNRRMQGTPDVDLYYGGQLTVGGNAPFPMGQFRYYVNESNPARLLNTCESMTADEAQVRFAVEANKWYFFTPLVDVALADIEVTNGASYVFRYYDAHNRAVNGTTGNQSWKNVDTDKLTAGQGYIFHCNTACEIVMPVDATGQQSLFNTKDVTRTLTVNEAELMANRSWNYVGNPYPSYYDIYYMDFTAPITVWTGSTYQAYSIADDEFVLRPMQSFFVQKPDAVDQIIFHKEGRQLTTDIAHGAAARAAQKASRQLFNIAISPTEDPAAIATDARADGDSPILDQTRIVINEAASVGYEVERDAAKFFSFETAVPQLFTIDQEGNSYAINERPQQDGTVALGYYAGKEGYYNIAALRADGEVSLYDAELDKTVDLATDSYTFHSEATDGVNQTRFRLLLATGGQTTAVPSVAVSQQQSQPLYDLQGRRINAQTMKKGIYVKDGRKVVRH